MPLPYIGYPQVRAHFFTEGGQLVRVGKANFVKQPRSFEVMDDRNRDQVLSVTTVKDMGSPAGHWSVTMTGADYRRGGGALKLLRLGDLAVIEMGPDKPQPTDTDYAKTYTKGLSGAEIVMIGCIDDIREDQAFTPDGRVSHTVTVAGRDLGKFFVDDPIWWDSWADPYSAILGLVNLVDFPRIVRFGEPADIIASILDNFLFAQFNVEFNLTARGNTKGKKQTRKLSEILRYAMAHDAPRIPFGSTAMSYEGALWNLFSQVASAPFYVLSLDVRRQQDIGLLLKSHPQTVDNVSTANVVWNTDLGHFDSQVCLTYYRNPWSNRLYDDWAQLPTRVITDDDVLSSGFSRSVEDVYNVWRALAQVPERARTESIGLLPDDLRDREQNLFRRFGARPRIVETPFYQTAAQASVFELVKQLTAQLRDWDIHNEFLLNGRIVMKGMAAVKVGDRLWWRQDNASEGIDFYVEGVEQDFQALTSWTTTVQVTRGQLHRDKRQPLFDKDGNVIRSPAVFGDVADVIVGGSG